MCIIIFSLYEILKFYNIKCNKNLKEKNKYIVFEYKIAVIRHYIKCNIQILLLTGPALFTIIIYKYLQKFYVRHCHENNVIFFIIV